MDQKEKLTIFQEAQLREKTIAHQGNCLNNSIIETFITACYKVIFSSKKALVEASSKR